MIRPSARALVVAAIVAALAAGQAAAATDDRSLATSTVRAETIEATLERAILEEINDARAERGLRPYRAAGGLAAAAASHARSMAELGFFSHSSADGTSADARIARFYGRSGYARWAVGEALVWRSPTLTAEQAVSMWLGSSSHRALLLSSRYTEAGIAAVAAADAPGVYGDDAAVVVVADFGARS